MRNRTPRSDPTKRSRALIVFRNPCLFDSRFRVLSSLSFCHPNQARRERLGDLIKIPNRLDLNGRTRLKLGPVLTEKLDHDRTSEGNRSACGLPTGGG